MDYLGLILVPLLLVILCVQLGIVAIKLDSIISLLKAKQ
jgi:hypothetical protein